MKKLLNDFKRFCSKGNILELATGVMIGGAFSAIVTSLVNDLLMPLIGLITGGINLSGLFIALDLQSYPSIDAAKAAGVGTLNYGAFLQAVINFLIMALVIFCLVKAMNALSSKMVHNKEAAPAAPTTKICPFCKSEIPIGATKCAHCTSELTEDAGSVINEAAAAGE